MIILISSFFLLIAGYVYIEIKGDDLPFSIPGKNEKNNNIDEQLAKNNEALNTLTENTNDLKENITKISEKIGSIEQGIVELLKQDDGSEVKTLLTKIETAIQNSANNDILVLNTLNEICTSFKNLQEIETTVTSNNNSLTNISKVLDEKFTVLSTDIKNQFDTFSGQINIQLKDIKNTAINSNINSLQTKIANASANTNNIKAGRIDNLNNRMQNGGVANNGAINNGIVNNNLQGNRFSQQATQAQYNNNAQQQRQNLNSQQNAMRPQNQLNQLNNQNVVNNQANNNNNNNNVNNGVKAETPQEKISIFNVKPKADDFSDFPSDLINEEVISGDELRKMEEEEERRIRIEEAKRKELERIEKERERAEREKEKQLREQEKQEREQERQRQKAIEQRQRAIEKQEQEKREREEKARRLAEKERIRQIKAEEKRRQEEEAMLRAEEKRREEEAAMAIVNNDSITIEEKADSIESLNESGARNTNNTANEDMQPEALIKTEEVEEANAEPEDVVQEVSLTPTNVEAVESKPYDDIDNINIEDNTSTAGANEQQDANNVLENLVIDNTKTEENNDSLEDDLKNFDVKIGEIQDNVIEDNNVLNDYSSKLDDFIDNDANVNTGSDNQELNQNSATPVINNDEIKDKLKELKDKLNN